MASWAPPAARLPLTGICRIWFPKPLHLLQVKENRSVGRHFALCHQFSTFLPFHDQCTETLSFTEPGAGPGAAWRGSPLCKVLQPQKREYRFLSWELLSGRGEAAMPAPTLAQPRTCSCCWHSLKGRPDQRRTV